MFSEPVVGEKFFGREEVLELLNKRVSALKEGYRQNVALTGQSLAGKTSILHHFLYSIKEEDFITIYVEVVKESFESFSRRFLATLLYNALTKVGENVGFELEGLLERAQKTLPKTYAAIKHINADIDQGKFDDAYLGLLGLTSVVKQEIRRSCIVILDEFDNLEYIGVKNPFLNFGKVIMIQKDTMYIVSSSRNQAIKKILSEKLSLLFGNFEIVKVAGFDTETSLRFIDLKLFGFEISDLLKKFLIAFTDGNPFYLNYIIMRARELASEGMTNYIDDEFIAQAILDLLYNSSGVIHQYLLNFILDLIDSRYKESAIPILISLANGRNKQAEIARALKIKQSEIAKGLVRLSELGFISKNGVFYKIDDTVLEFWLRHVYQRRRELLVDGIFNRTELFRTEVRAYMLDSLRVVEQNIAERLAELFNSFSNELVQINSKHMRVPHFTKVEIKVAQDSKPFILASFRGKTWLVQPFEDTISENDIIEYIRNSKTLGYKVLNKIIIPFKGMDENAKLLAKELRISIWDSATVNTLLSFYGKKRIVVI